MGSTVQGVTTTLGRGGADGTAAILGAVLGAEEIQIWTETSGMTTVDPRIEAGARVIPQVSPDEAAELAYFGTKVLHPVMIQPAVERGIPVRVLNTQEPSAAGTLVSPAENLGPSGPCAVVHRGGITVLLISQPRMLMASGFLARVFDVFERHHTPVDLVATSEVSVSLTIDNVEQLAAIKAELAKLGEVRILREMAIVALVGRGFFRYAGLARRIFDSLSEVNVVMISFAASDVNVSIVVEEADAEKAVHALHREFFGPEGSPA
jgi:aspartate kinase